MFFKIFFYLCVNKTIKIIIMNLEQKINYLEKKFNAPMDIIIKAINICNKEGVNIQEIELKTMGV